MEERNSVGIEGKKPEKLKNPDYLRAPVPGR